MSVFAVGPAFDLDGPLPVAPRHSLLETQGVVKERDATRVLNGVNLWGYPEGCPSIWEPCSDGTFRTKSANAVWPTPRFDAVVIYQGAQCSTISSGGDPQELFRRIDAVLDATLSSGVEKMLAEGYTESSNPFFGDTNVNVLNSGTAVPPERALSYLEQEIGTTCRRGMLHLTPASVVGAQANPLEAQERLETTNGTPVVSGMGYQSIDTPFLGTPGATQDWAFATGPVEVYLGPVVARTPMQSIEHSTNVLTYRAERYVLAVWDTALQSAVLVDWAT